MSSRFYAILALISILAMAWIAVHYKFEEAQQQQLEDLTSYPIYAYVADTSKVSPMMAELKRFPELDSLHFETGAQAGRELVDTYSLPVSDDLLAGFSFPDLITLELKAIPASRWAKTNIINTLRQFIPEEDIDAQSIAWAKSEAKLKSLILLKILSDILIGILLLIVFIFVRMHFEQRLLLLHKRKQVSVVDYLRHKSQTRNHSIMLLVVPLVLGLGTYAILAWQNVLAFILPYWYMGAVAVTLLIGSLLVMIFIHLMDHDNRLHEGEIQVKVSEPEPEITDEP